MVNPFVRFPKLSLGRYRVNIFEDEHDQPVYHISTIRETNQQPDQVTNHPVIQKTFTSQPTD